MTPIIKIIIAAIISYLIGALNPAYIYGKIRGIDIRSYGSGNPGGSNAMIVYGRIVGLFVIIFDILKGALCTRGTILFLTLGVNAVEKGGMLFYTAVCLSLVFAVMGHMFPIYMGFKGGKGLACYGGAILGFHPLVFLGFVVFAVVMLLVFDYIALIPVVGSWIFPIVFLVMSKSPVLGLLLFIPAIVILLKHKENLVKIKEGTEMHALKFLRKGDEERKRTNMEKVDFSKEDMKKKGE